MKPSHLDETARRAWSTSATSRSPPAAPWPRHRPHAARGARHAARRRAARRATPSSPRGWPASAERSAPPSSSRSAIRCRSTTSTWSSARTATPAPSTIRAEARATARTGRRDGGPHGGLVAALTLYDMAKALQRDIVIERVELLEKSGGRSGDYPRGRSCRRAEHEAVVVTCSNRSAAGEREDASGPALVAALREAGFDVAPDAARRADDEAEIAIPAGSPGRCRPSAHPHHRRHRPDADRRDAGRHAPRDRPRGSRAWPS